MTDTTTTTAGASVGDWHRTDLETLRLAADVILRAADDILRTDDDFGFIPASLESEICLFRDRLERALLQAHAVPVSIPQAPAPGSAPNVA